MEKMGTVILTTQNPDIVGGAQNLMQDMAEATNGKIVYTRNPFKKVPYATLSEPPFWKFSIDADFFIFMDDITQWYLFNHSDVPHIRYFNTPRRAFYDMQYFSPRWVRALGFAYRPIDRSFVKKYVKNIASNSHNIRNRGIQGLSIPVCIQKSITMQRAKITGYLLEEWINGNE
jgi:hypothetical protein